MPTSRKAVVGSIYGLPSNSSSLSLGPLLGHRTLLRLMSAEPAQTLHSPRANCLPKSGDQSDTDHAGYELCFSDGILCDRRRISRNRIFSFSEVRLKTEDAHKVKITSQRLKTPILVSIRRGFVS